jgi:hypothetical protein
VVHPARILAAASRAGQGARSGAIFREPYSQSSGNFARPKFEESLFYEVR